MLRRLAQALSCLMLVFSCSSCSEPSNDEVVLPELTPFAAQIISNSQIVVLTPPSTKEGQAWAEQPEWDSEERVLGVSVLIAIDRKLIEAAALQWKKDLGLNDNSLVDRAKADLTRRFLRAGNRTFLLVSQQLRGNYPDWWGYTYEGISSKTKIRSFSGNIGNVFESESCENGIVSHFSPTFTCVFIALDTVQEADPFFHVEIPIRYFLKSVRSRNWIKSNQIYIARFRFETAEVPLIAYTQRNIEWAKIEETYIGKHLSTMRAINGNGANEFLVGIAIDIASGLLLKGLRL